MALVHVNQHDNVVLLDDAGDLGVGVEQTAQLVTPPSPVCAELQDDPLVFRLRRFQSVGNLLIAVRGSVVELGALTWARLCLLRTQRSLRPSQCHAHDQPASVSEDFHMLGI